MTTMQHAYTRQRARQTRETENHRMTFTLPGSSVTPLLQTHNLQQLVNDILSISEEAASRQSANILRE
jgi:hypothetical protein